MYYPPTKLRSPELSLPLFPSPCNLSQPPHPNNKLCTESTNYESPCYAIFFILLLLPPSQVHNKSRQKYLIFMVITEGKVPVLNYA